MTFIYDTEVFLCDWVAVFLDPDENRWYIFHNDRELLMEFMQDNADALFIGFNSKHYDQHIIRAIAGGLDNETVKELSDWIVDGGQGWACPYLDDIRFRFNNVDIRDDMQQGLSLKAIEAHLMMDIQETEVDFNLRRPLTDEELARTVAYCRHDVEATAQVVKLRKNYLDSKVQVGALAGIPAERALAMTNAKLTAALLKAQKREYDDERKYVMPDNLLREYIPDEVFAFFDRMKDKSLTDEEVFKSKLNIRIGECPVTIAYGGIHGAIPNFMWKESPGRTIRNWDVASYYPSLMIKNGYTSRSIPSAAVFEETYSKRIAAKKSGDKATANALKLVLNTTYGATLNSFNDLYDPLMARSVCISGQLYLTELAHHMLRDIPDLRIVQLNTDGIMVELSENDLPAARAIADEWQQRTGFGLEEDWITLIAQKDVNNYVMLEPDGHIKAKGGYLVRGIAPAGAFNINNQAVIVADALREYFIHGTPAADTVNACDDISKFQLIAKAGAKYRDAAWEYGGRKYPVQKVNRVYASGDPQAGRITKVKLADDSEALIASMPEHSVIDNRAVLTIKDIDKGWYIALAEKRIDDFKGIKPVKGHKTMAEKKPMNVYQKLAEMRLQFLNQHVDKSGKHMKMQFTYFELDDIVPTALRLAKDIGLLMLDAFDEHNAVLNIINVDDASEMVTVSLPFSQWEGNAGVNPLQAMGATITYYRRYLYMIALDICTPDEIDSVNAIPAEPAKPAAQPAAEAPKAEPAKPKGIVTPIQREQVKTELAAPDGPATDLQIAQLKEGLKVLMNDPKNTIFIQGIVTSTNKFQNLTKSRCEAIMKEVGERINV